MSDRGPRGAEAVLLRLRDRHAARLRDFRRDERGSLIILGLFCFVMMLMLAGVALDLMRFEERRTTLQNTTDRAVLAAADLRQTLPPKDVVKDYFKKAGLAAPKDSDIIVQQGTFGEWRTVQANVTEKMPTWFMNMYGIDIKELTTPASGTAEERIGNVEISLVLDVSGSMANNNRLVNLKPAAKAFIDQMFDTVESGKLSVSIITYSTQVAAGPDVYKYFQTTQEHTASTCLEFIPADFSSSTLKPILSGLGRVYQLGGHFDPFYTTLTSYSTSTAQQNVSQSLFSCPMTGTTTAFTNRYITAFSGNRSALKAKIDSLYASGNTSIDIGMKWGAGLLDPSMRPVVQGMIAEGKVSSGFSERPYDYKKANGQWNDEALKVIVLMTDGENTTEYQLRDAYDHGTSLLYRNTTTQSLSGLKRYSLYNPSTGKYWSFNTGAWRNQAWGVLPTDLSSDPIDTAVPMTWPEVWATMSVNYFADNIIGAVYGSTERNKWRTSNSNAYATAQVVDTTKDTQTLAACTAAKNNNVKIFTIAFEAPAVGKTLLKSCASSNAHALEATGLNIQKAFASIASSINKLRLTH